MNLTDSLDVPKNDSKILRNAALGAIILEFVVLTLIGNWEHWLAHPQKNNSLDESKFIEAEVVQVPEQAHLSEDKKISVPQPKEVTLSKKPGVGKKEKPADQMQDQNQTNSPGLNPPNHGPIAVFAPQPTIPSYLQSQQFKTSVVIDFFVNAQGGSVPRLVGSSGNDELDALALNTAKKWQFRPGEENHKPIDAKVRLRIIFQVQ